MDEKSLIAAKRITPSITSEGIAGLWLRYTQRDGSRDDQISLGNLIESVLAEGIRIGKQEAITLLNSSPTVGAAVASLESDIVELERAVHKKQEDGIDFDVWSA